MYKDLMEAKLLKYQVPHFFQMEEILKVKKCALDASDTGTGKTYVAIALAQSLGKDPFIICPKSVIPNWISVAKTLDVKLFGIANYEMIKACKYYTPKLEKVDCPYMDKYKVVDPPKKTKKTNQTTTDTTSEPKKHKIIEDFCFSLPSNVMVIFDEAHRCKNHKSITSRLLLSIFRCNCKVLLLSATISDKIPCFKPFGVVFGFYNELKEFTIWLRKNIKARTIQYKDKIMSKDQMSLDIIHSKMFPEYGSRMKIKELGSMFPSNQVLSQSYMYENQEEIQAQYKIINEAFEELKSKETRSAGLGKLIRARMKIEMLKVPIILDIVEEALDSKYSVVIFCNYKDTMYYLAHYFETECLIHGDQTMEERQHSIDQFQSNKSQIIIAIIQAGGVGISLHDIHGGHPRMSVINPTWSGQDMQQALGRIHRAGAQTPAMQRIVFCAGTYEEKICELIKGKLTNISAINDGDLVGPRFTEEEYTEVAKTIDKINLMDLSTILTNNSKTKKIVKKHKSDNTESDASDDIETNDSRDDTESADSDNIKKPKNVEKKTFKRIISANEKKHFVKKVIKDCNNE